MHCIEAASPALSSVSGVLLEVKGVWALQAANRLAQPHMHPVACSVNPGLRSGYRGLSDASTATLGQLLDLHDSLLERTPAGQHAAPDTDSQSAGQKRKRGPDTDDSVAGGSHMQYLGTSLVSGTGDQHCPCTSKVCSAGL